MHVPRGVTEKDLQSHARAAMRSEARIGPRFKPNLEIDADGIATIAAEVDNIAVKRRALERLAGTTGISGIVDRLRVKPAIAMSDDGILDHLRKALYAEPAFGELAIRECKAGKAELVRGAPHANSSRLFNNCIRPCGPRLVEALVGYLLDIVKVATDLEVLTGGTGADEAVSSFNSSRVSRARVSMLTLKARKRQRGL
jgi:hypothetical protein